MKLFFSCLVGIGIISFAITSPVIASALDLVPGGQNIGIEIRPDGLIVSGTYDIKVDKNTTYNPTRDSDIKVGDIIYEANNVEVSSLSDFVKTFNGISGESATIDIKLKRASSKISRKLKLIKVGDNYKTGLFIKERILGIGTVSFYDPETKMYGALGHEILDRESNNIIEVETGMIYESTVTSISKSENGNPGEKNANIDLTDSLGDIVANTKFGIYGTYDELPKNSSLMKMAQVNEVKVGDAEIWTVTASNTVKKYKIRITHLENQKEVSTKGISLKVIDPELLKISNGIVAGMSGSPIIQNNMLVGAVTHVVVDNVQSGYGIYMEWMLETARNIYQSN